MRILITNGKIVDGAGNPWFFGDLLIDGATIAAIGRVGSISRDGADEIVDATGHIVAPGFIDIQSHSIVPFLTDRRAISKVSQGVTTEIMGELWTPAPFGGRITNAFARGLRRRVGGSFDEWVERSRSWTRFGDWLADFASRGVSVNIGSFLGGATLREYARGHEMGPSSPEELETMRRVMADAMEDGAFGLATALIYPPNSYVDTDELVEMCKVVARYEGIHITHMRSEEDRILTALDETIDIARRSGVITEIYHIKAAGERNWPKMAQMLDRINRERAAGLDITGDMYPYDSGGTGLTAVVPPWAEEGDRLYERLKNPAEREQIASAIRAAADGDVDWANFGNVAGAHNVLIAAPEHPELERYTGWWLSDIAADRGQDWVDAALDLLAIEGHDIFTLYRMMSEENMIRQLQQPWMTVSTDAGGVNPDIARTQGLTHPRAYGTYTRVLAHFVRDLQALTIEDAVRKMSGSVASRLGLWNRGILRPGMAADIVIFDPETVSDVGTYTDPHHLSVGMRDVWVNGGRVWRDNAHTGALPGQRVDGPGRR